MLPCQLGLVHKLRYLLYSIVAHVVVLGCAIFVAWWQQRATTKAFVALGLHSKESHVFFKDMPLPHVVRRQNTAVASMQPAPSSPKAVDASVKSAPTEEKIEKSSCCLAPQQDAKPIVSVAGPTSSPKQSTVVGNKEKVAQPPAKKHAVEIPEHIKQRVVVTAQDRQRQQLIAQEIARLWSPPLGVPQGVSCRVKFILDKRGSIEKAIFVERSAYYIYDLSIMQVVHQFSFDKSLWGMEFTVDFTQ